MLNTWHASIKCVLARASVSLRGMYGISSLSLKHGSPRSPTPCRLQLRAWRGSAHICRKHSFVVSAVRLRSEYFYCALGLSPGRVMFHLCSILMSPRGDMCVCIRSTGRLVIPACGQTSPILKRRLRKMLCSENGAIFFSTYLGQTSTFGQRGL